jgi:hypothetical protein
LEAQVSSDTRQVFGLIELDRARSVFAGKIIGFPHIEIEGQALADVERRLREVTTAMIASDSLVLETEFIAVIALAGGANSIADLKN